ncbi:recombination protein RecR [Candidatus Gottesmanbacteria bacterium RIFCSPLOWO2_01_FULL_46_21]|uniref:Recombination protein RecR n=1 Tax=Candidatus Gottesmanbacteria bacterium RIFCSPLOWO2_01_FULL_46_21 TaxID=1798393 RepID=A0A1F6AYA5_9BACT|nr:MAG: recombination protein RecR [Candidatus Gottesmanbacteria bacterium RIFCSPLOWO2_01_FULL_46_21]
MSLLPKALSRLIESFEKLPGIGPKTAQRLAFYLLHVPQDDLDSFAGNLSGLKSQTVLCSLCKNVAEADPCSICSNPTRDQSIICVVEQPTDVLSIEKTGKFKGVYHVLHGAIDPLNNVGPDEIYIDHLLKRLHNVGEIILATNPTMEGEATAMYIQKQIHSLITHNSPASLREVGRALRITRLAHGLPVGADIEYADEVTLSRALEGRREF